MTSPSEGVLLQIPASTSAHDVAATLLAFFASLPNPFMPPAAAQVCDVCVPSASAASSLLADSLSPVEWAVFRHISGQTQAFACHLQGRKNVFPQIQHHCTSGPVFSFI